MTVSTITHPDSPTTFDKVAGAIRLIADAEGQAIPSLDELAQAADLSPAHFQRLFKRWAGVSPKQFSQFLQKEQAVARLKAGRNVLDASLDTGLSSPGRLHDLIVTTTAITPGQARMRGDGVEFQTATFETVFGPALAAWTQRGLSFLSFLIETESEDAEQQLRAQWPAGRFVSIKSDDPRPAALAKDIASGTVRGKLHLSGSPFQLQVWEALLNIPPAAHLSYGDLARSINKRGAARAVGSAVGSNPVAWLIPCHRVIRDNGGPGGYRWGLTVKQAMIGRESAQLDSPDRASDIS